MAEGLPRRLRLAFMLQVAIASLVIVAGTWVSVVVARLEIAEHAMQEEVDYFWRMRAGDPAAREELAALVYPDLRRMAARYLRRERPGHTLQEGQR